MRVKTLILTGSRIRKFISMPQVLRIAKAAFAAHGRGRVQMPAKIYLHLDKHHGDFRAMPAYIEGLEACGIKWVNVHPQNRSRGLPSIMAVIILSDPRTGYPLAVMDGTAITNFRTGAAGGLAASYCARRGSDSAGFVGCGAQALHQFLALNELFTLRSVTAYDKDQLRAQRFVAYAKKRGIRATKASTVEACVRDRDIVVTTTPSRKPIIKSAWISPGTHINAIGADARGKEELDPALLKRATIIVDDREQAMHSGEINVPLSRKIITAGDIKGTLGEIIAGKMRGRASSSEVTVFDSTGLAIQDVAVAAHVYNKARRSPGARSVRLIS